MDFRCFNSFCIFLLGFHLNLFFTSIYTSYTCFCLTSVFLKAQALLCLVEFIIHWCPPDPFSSSFFFFLKWFFYYYYFYFFGGKGNRSEDAEGWEKRHSWVNTSWPCWNPGWAGVKNEDKTGVTSLVGKFWAVSRKPVWCHFACSPWAPFAGAWPGERSVTESLQPVDSLGEPQRDLYYWCATCAVPVTPWCFRILHAWLSCGLWHELWRQGTGFPEQLSVQPSPCKFGLFLSDSTKTTTVLNLLVKLL